MTVPVEYRRGGEKAVASYSYEDIAEGKGVVIFNAGDLSGANVLTSSTFYPLYGYTRFSTAAQDLDFDAEFNLPKIVDGDAIISFPFAIFNDTGGVHSQTQYVHYSINKIDTASNESVLVSGSQAFDNQGMANADKEYQNMAMELDIPQTHFKATEKLRLNVVVGAGTDVDVHTTIGHDPKGSTDIGEDTLTWPNTTKAEFHVPFKLDL